MKFDIDTSTRQFLEQASQRATRRPASQQRDMVSTREVSIVDIMSSPDPINESDSTQHIMSSARRITRSQASVRHYSLASSPKKQTFELDVGNQISPQKILVTVEAEDAAELDGPAVNRRLFQSPSVKRSARRKAADAPSTTTTTTVPLRGLTDDETSVATDATPRRRGRPKRTGTPARTQRKRPGTPKAAPKAVPKTRTRASSRSSVLASESETGADDQPTPKPRANTKRKASSPIKEDSSIAGSARKRGRPRKQAALSPELGMVSEQEIAMDAEVEDNASVEHIEDTISVAGSRVDEGPVDDMEEDIWLATLSDQPTPIARRSTRTDTSNVSRIADYRPDPRPDPLPERAQSEASQADATYGRYEDWGAAEPQSDVESMVSDKQGAEERQDTVMASEEFTMISIGSLPSMQRSMLASSVMAVEQEDLGEETSLIINRTLESLRQSQMKRDGATEEERPGEVPNTGQHDLKADAQAQPTSPHTIDRSPRRAAKPAPSLGRQLALKSLQVAGRGSPERLPVPEPIEAHDTSAYDDSFSEIPEEVLLAATPSRLRKPPTETREDTAKPDVQPSIERPSTVNHSNPQSEANRLLTPDETPSPVPSEGEEKSDDEKSPGPAPDQEMHSSPPIPSAVTQRGLDAAVPRHVRMNSTETPTEQVSGFALKANSVVLAPPEPHQRPTLSPIVRAGRALQLVTSDPPSPPGRGSVLRSPFRGSARSSQSPAPPSATRKTESPAVQEPVSVRQPERPWLNPMGQFKNLVAASARALSPRQVPVLDMEDPFGPNSTASPVSESVRNFVSSLRGKRSSANVQETANTAAAPIDNEDAMSWRGDDGAVQEAPKERSLSPDLSMHEVGDGEQVGWNDGPAQNEQNPQDLSDQPFDRGDQEMDDDDDLWAFEAERSMPGPTKSVPSRSEEFEPPRRSKIPSPWRRVGNRQADEARAQAVSKANAQQPDWEDMSMLSQQSRKAQDTASQDRVAPKNVDLSAFFSSPAPLPGAQPDGGFGLFKALDAPRLRNLDTIPDPELVSTSVPSVLAPGLYTNRPSAQPSPYKSFGAQRSTRQARRQAKTIIEDIDSVLKPSRQNAVAPNAEPSSPSTPDKVEFGHIPQKMNFTPRSRQATNDLFQPRVNSLFANSQMHVFAAKTVVNTVEQHEESSPESSFVRPQLKALPDRAQSPTKSCMRSPLKPKTPGRVVEFTSSTLSPLAQAQARAERRASASPEKQLSPGSNTSSAGSSGPEEDKENQGHTSESEHEQERKAQRGSNQSQQYQTNMPALASQPPPAPQSPIKSTFAKPGPSAGVSSGMAATTTSRIQKLSSTKWSYDHWVRLDQLLQARRQGILQLQLQLKHARGSGTRGRSLECQMLQGKWMRARGRQLTVEEWHLDVVDAFRDEVGWGDDVDLAKRVLGLLMGEERRRLGLVPRRR